MKKEKLEPYQEHIQRLVALFVPELYLREYAYTVDWFCEKQYPDALAHIKVDIKYLTFHVHVDGKAMKRHFAAGRSYKIANAVMHELCHVHTQPMYELIPLCDGPQNDFIKEVWERQTQRMANVVLGLIPRKKWEIRK